MEVTSFAEQFAQWKQTQSACVLVLEKSGTPLGTCKLVFCTAGNERIEMSHTEGSFFVESAEDPRVQDLNNFLLCEQPTFCTVLDRLNAAVASRKKARSLIESYGSLSVSAGSDIDVVESMWSLEPEEKEHLLAQVAALDPQCVSVNEDLGTVVLRLEPAAFVSAGFSETFSLSEEKIVVTLDYTTPVLPVVKVAQFKSPRESIGVILIRRMIEHFFTAVRSGNIAGLRPAQEEPEVTEKKAGLSTRLRKGVESVKDMFGARSDSSEAADRKNVANVMRMGFSREQAEGALKAANNSIDLAVEKLLENPDQFQPVLDPAFNVFSGLLSYLAERFQRPFGFCAACHAPHRCGGTLPIICGNELCVYSFESYFSAMECRLCPMEDCNSGRGIDSSLALCEALRSSGGTFGISLSTLL